MVNAGMCPGCWLGFRFQEGWASIWLGAANSKKVSNKRLWKLALFT